MAATYLYPIIDYGALIYQPQNFHWPQFDKIMNRITGTAMNTPYNRFHPKFVSSRKRNIALGILSTSSRAKFREASFALRLHRGITTMEDRDQNFRRAPPLRMATRYRRAILTYHLSMGNPTRRIAEAWNKYYNWFQDNLTIETLKSHIWKDIWEAQLSSWIQVTTEVWQSGNAEIVIYRYLPEAHLDAAHVEKWYTLVARNTVMIKLHWIAWTDLIQKFIICAVTVAIIIETRASVWSQSPEEWIELLWGTNRRYWCWRLHYFQS